MIIKILKVGFNSLFKKLLRKHREVDLYRYHWEVHCPLAEETVNQPYELFHDCFVITFTVE